MGMNMVTKGVHNVIEYSPDMDVIEISDNFFSDINKPAAVNCIERHGTVARYKAVAILRIPVTLRTGLMRKRLYTSDFIQSPKRASPVHNDGGNNVASIRTRDTSERCGFAEHKTRLMLGRVR
ncbi:hypothetical protein DY000_02018910 [Brassica cretica]|uniref:Uncharacterized protein n=1 Tax=Brassica cretica TaxID=69181 RepID=A0ABQ7D6T2_BRACR|nr:hypothetical protein DY000_02018910 [Brassica cretica]